jgi:RND family efflux transporter MFP subunit
MENKMKKHFTSIAILILFTALFISCGSDDNQTDNRTAVKVKGKKVVQQQAAQTYSFSGNIEGERKVTISTKLMGRVSYLPFEEGDKVNAGQTIIKVDSDDLLAKKAQVQAGRAEATAAYENTKKNYDRIKKLYEKGSATQKEMDDITMHFEMIKAKLNSVDEMENEINDFLTYANIKAPFTGYITMKFLQEGDMANPGMPLVTIESLNKMKVKASVSESEIHLLEKGDQVKIKVDAVPGQVFNGTVESIDAGAHPASRQFSLDVIFNNSDSRLKSGMYANVILEKGEKNSIKISMDWVIERGQLTGLYTLNQANEVMLRWVKLGKETNGKVEVLSGLTDGEVIIDANANVSEGQKVEVTL